MNKMKKIVLITLLILQAFAFSAGTVTAALGNGKKPNNNGRPQNESTLKDLAKNKNLHIGIATQTHYIRDGKYADVLNNEFDMITPEYQMKMGVIAKQRGQYDFSQADELVNYAQKNNKLVRGHTLVWHQSLPDWINNGKYTRDEWVQILKEYITTVVSHFKGKVYGWDVVNEAFWTNGDYRPSVWYTNIGPEYIELAFKFAHEADPNAKLFYNDFDAEVTNEKSDAIYKMISNLKSKGVPIDGIGFQMHLTIDGLNYSDMKQNFKRFADLGLDTDVTEMDVITHTFSGTQDEKLKTEADVYAKVLKTALSLPSVKTFIMWGLKDDQSWLNEDTGFQEYPLLFDDSYNKKPAYYAIRDQLSK